MRSRWQRLGSGGHGEASDARRKAVLLTNGTKPEGFTPEAAISRSAAIRSAEGPTGREMQNVAYDERDGAVHDHGVGAG